MRIIISPAKSLDYENPAPILEYSQPQFLKEARKLIKVMKTYSPQDLASLMKISDKLAQLNVSRYEEWKTPFTPSNAKQALFAFKGDVYTGLDSETLTKAQINFAQDHLLILSGLYGLLKPLDLMQAYRLEMGSQVANSAGKDLYTFWGEQITSAINESLATEKKPLLVNLASQEYFKSVHQDKIQGEIITPVFKDKKSREYKIVSFFAKKARGMMARYLITNKAKSTDQIKAFNEAGYAYNEGFSNKYEWVFTREAPIK